LNTKAPAPNPETTIPDASPLLFGNQLMGMVRVGMMTRFCPIEDRTPKESTTGQRLELGGKRSVIRESIWEELLDGQ
jgi:hypothetical protein